MGGIGSGRWGGKGATDSMRALDIRKIQRSGGLIPGARSAYAWSCNGEKTNEISFRAENERVILSYKSRSNGGEWQTMDYSIYLDWTYPNLGGRRAWFLCPARGCGRRVAILYGGATFACRHCYKLVYRCQKESGKYLAFRRAETIRRRLGWEPGVASGEGQKPKGMHWRTFEKRVAAYNARVRDAMMGSDRLYAALLRK